MNHPTHPMEQHLESLPFPPLNWWRAAVCAKEIVLNANRLYQKNRPQNRYQLAGSQGAQVLSIPLKGGRNQRKQISGIEIAYAEDWRSHHWKTIKTLYQRSPFFEYYEYEIADFYRREVALLHDWNTQSIKLVIEVLGLDVALHQSSDPAAASFASTATAGTWFGFPQSDGASYHQVFQEKWGFIPNCSILDLLFCEGPNALSVLIR